MWERLCCGLQFEPLGPCVQASKRRHINVGEVRGALRAECSTGQRWPGCRFLQLLDSQVATACLVKGRSSSRSLNRELRRSLPDHLTQQTHPRYGFIRPRFNPSDDPTRDVPLRKPSEPLPSWWESASRGDFAQLDLWLLEIGLHLDQLRGCPMSPSLDPTLLLQSLMPIQLADIEGKNAQKLLQNGFSDGPPSQPLTCWSSSTGCQPKLARGVLSRVGEAWSSQVARLCMEVSSDCAARAMTSRGRCKHTVSIFEPSARS